MSLLVGCCGFHSLICFLFLTIDILFLLFSLLAFWFLVFNLFCCVFHFVGTGKLLLDWLQQKESSCKKLEKATQVAQSLLGFRYVAVCNRSSLFSGDDEFEDKILTIPESFCEDVYYRFQVSAQLYVLQLVSCCCNVVVVAAAAAAAMLLLLLLFLLLVGSGGGGGVLLCFLLLLLLLLLFLMLRLLLLCCNSNF